MLNRRAGLYAVLLIAIAACTKQETTPITESVESTSVDQLWWPGKNQAPFPNPNPGPIEQTIFGLTQEQTLDQNTQQAVNESIALMNEAGVDITRASITLSETISSDIINSYLANGYEVQILANWNGGQNGYRGFPNGWEMDEVKSRAKAFFEYYAPYKDQIPFVAIENEWDWEVVHGSNLQDYLTELAVITDIGHQYGFKVTDGGITSTALQRWTYSQLSPDDQAFWIANYFVGLNAGAIDYNTIIGIVNTFIEGVKNIDIDYINMHWINATTCGNGFETATQVYMEACDKKEVVCNEFCIRTSSNDLFGETVNEIKGNAKYAIAYSGPPGGEVAIKLTDEMLYELNLNND